MNISRMEIMKDTKEFYMPNTLILTEEQRDILTESINIGFGRAAASLSILVGHKIMLEVPKISVITGPELAKSITGAYKQPISVQQHFSGGIHGDVILFMDMDIASIFIDLLSGGSGNFRRLTPSDREALLEVGNILLNAYIGSFGNLMNAQINIAVPELRTGAIERFFSSIALDDHHVLLVWTKFMIHQGTVAGHVALILDANSLESLFTSIQFDGFQS